MAWASGHRMQVRISSLRAATLWPQDSLIPETASGVKSFAEQEPQENPWLFLCNAEEPGSAPGRISQPSKNLVGIPVKAERHRQAIPLGDDPPGPLCPA